MNDSTSTLLSAPQKVCLVVLRIFIGWHFLYEGYFKLILPAWTTDGTCLARWSAASYLKEATGPFGHLLQSVFNTRYGHLIDIAVIAGLCAIGLSLILGLFTQMGCYGAIGMLALFYLTAIPLDGAPHSGMEGNYLIVNKNLIELAAVAVLLCFQTSRVAGLDLFYFEWREKHHPSGPQSS